MPFDQSLAEECVDFALFFGINPHYMLAVAQLRSGLTDKSGPPRFGPFQLTQEEWEAARTDQEYGSVFNFSADQIKSWRCTCDMFALMTFRTQNTQLAALKRYPSAMELYAAQWPNDPPLTVAQMTAALQATAALVAPAAATLADPAASQGSIADPTNAVQPVRPKTAPTDSSFGTGPFKEKAPRVMRSLMADFGLSAIQSAGILGNLGHESGGFRFFHENGKPLDKGGVGWAQWTGSRRTEFEAFCTDQHVDPTSDQANYGFLRFELQHTSERTVLPLLKNTVDLSTAVNVFLTKYERAGVSAVKSRLAFGTLALTAFNAQTRRA